MCVIVVCARVPRGGKRRPTPTPPSETRGRHPSARPACASGTSLRALRAATTTAAGEAEPSSGRVTAAFREGRVLGGTSGGGGSALPRGTRAHPPPPPSPSPGGLGGPGACGPSALGFPLRALEISVFVQEFPASLGALASIDRYRENSRSLGQASRPGMSPRGPKLGFSSPPPGWPGEEFSPYGCPSSKRTLSFSGTCDTPFLMKMWENSTAQGKKPC